MLGVCSWSFNEALVWVARCFGCMCTVFTLAAFDRRGRCFKHPGCSIEKCKWLLREYNLYRTPNDEAAITTHNLTFPPAEAFPLCDLGFCSWNENWVSQESNLYYTLIVVVAVAAYIGAIVWWSLLFVYYTSDAPCQNNKTFIALTIIFCVGFTVLSITEWCGAYDPRVLCCVNTLKQLCVAVFFVLFRFCFLACADFCFQVVVFASGSLHSPSQTAVVCTIDI